MSTTKYLREPMPADNEGIWKGTKKSCKHPKQVFITFFIEIKILRQGSRYMAHV